jgi:hypothetical protein
MKDFKEFLQTMKRKRGPEFIANHSFLSRLLEHVRSKEIVDYGAGI